MISQDLSDLTISWSALFTVVIFTMKRKEALRTILLVRQHLFISSTAKFSLRKNHTWKTTCKLHVKLVHMW